MAVSTNYDEHDTVANSERKHEELKRDASTHIDIASLGGLLQRLHRLSLCPAGPSQLRTGSQ